MQPYAREQLLLLENQGGLIYSMMEAVVVSRHIMLHCYLRVYINEHLHISV